MLPLSRNGRHPTTNRPTVPETARLLGRRTRELARHLPAAVGGDAVAVHRARVASRRLREALPVLAAGAHVPGKLRRRVRRVTRALGRVRELDVTLQILDEFAQRPGVPRDAIEDVRGHVLAARKGRRTAMLHQLERVKPDRLGRRLDALAEQLPGPEPDAWREALVERVDRRAARLAGAIQEAGQMYAPDRLHQVRIAAKKLRYALELALDSRVPVRSWLASLRGAQDTLGRLHDLQIIQHHVAAVQAHPPVHRHSTTAGLERIARGLERECRHLHAAYVKGVPTLLAAAEECGPAVRGSLRRRRTDRMHRRTLRRRPSEVGVQGSRRFTHVPAGRGSDGAVSGRNGRR